MTDSESITPLRYLSGQPINAVTFIHDYLQLLVGDRILTCGAMPILVARAGERLNPGDNGYCDAICARIGDRLDDCLNVPPLAIVLTLHSGYRLEVPFTVAGDVFVAETENGMPLVVSS